MQNLILPIILAALGSSGLFNLIQFLIARRSGVSQRLDLIQTEIKSLKHLINENEAMAARIRIINFADKMRVTTLGKEAWLQVLRDIDAYETYCSENPNYKNSYAKLSIELIKDKYEEDQKNDKQSV